MKKIAVLVMIVSCCLGQGCPIKPGSPRALITNPCGTDYYKEIFRIGFSPPPQLNGPTDSPDPGADLTLIWAQGETAALSMSLKAFAGSYSLEQWRDLSLPLLSDFQVQNEDLTTLRSGEPAWYYLVKSVANKSLTEAFTVRREGRIFVLSANYKPDLPRAEYDSIWDAFASFCIK